MTFRNDADLLAFTKICVNLILIKFFDYFILVGSNVALEGIKNKVHFSQELDILFSARCEAKCWNKANVEKIPCIRSCLNSLWNKPGECPLIEKQIEPNFYKCFTNVCENDIDCAGTQKCCRQSNNTTCCEPERLENVSGLLSIPNNVTAWIKKNESDAENVKICVEWTSVLEINATEKIFYIVEECHHTGKQYHAEKLTKWNFCKKTSRTVLEFKNLIKPGRWYRFRISAVNENGTRGPSLPTQPLFSSIIPTVPRAPANLKVSATSWGNGQFHAQLTWSKSISEIPVSKYKITWSMLRNLTFVQHHYTLPPTTTRFWLHDLAPDTEYFLHVQGYAHFGRKNLIGKYASIVFQTTSPPNVAKHFSNDTELQIDLKYKRRIKDFYIEQLFWLHDELLARITWTPIKRSATDYFICWFLDSSEEERNIKHVAKTDMTNFELYGLEPGYRYSVSVKAIRHHTLYVANNTFSTDNCKRNSSALDNEVVYCR